ncbi:ImmA/IrrE family metallo-endopeptidase [Streptomyces sp. PLAI1-29]|uniref:ImmA/IrrE family metallo-endopeptidase n=2 Tax=Streptomyces zingiberis TaxID=2053010 RepID=A0ABX1C3E6_9ACTN|nr:ImmA/IrrE family metallo-endopeptidase [Streptomyces zingiberis]
MPTWPEVGERIAEARQAIGLSQGRLAEQVGLERTALVRIEAGDRRVTALELFQLAEALDVPAAHFVSRPPAALVSRRAALEEEADAASRARYRLDARLEAHARNAEWLVGHGFLHPPAPDPAPARRGETADPLALARAARKAIGAPAGPLPALVDVAEALGLFLTVVDEEAEGASLLHDGYGVAVITGRSAPARRRWTAAHELGHHLLQDKYHSDTGVSASRDEREQLIDRFAGEFLLPEEDVRRAWQRIGPEQGVRSTLIGLAADHRLSWSAVVARARQCELLDPAEARRIKADTPVRGDFLSVRGGEPAPDLPNGATGRLWRRAVLRAWQDGAITAPRTVELLYGAVTEDDLPGRNLEDCSP